MKSISFCFDKGPRGNYQTEFEQFPTGETNKCFQVECKTVCKFKLENDGLSHPNRKNKIRDKINNYKCTFLTFKISTRLLVLSFL